MTREELEKWIEEQYEFEVIEPLLPPGFSRASIQNVCEMLKNSARSMLPLIEVKCFENGIGVEMLDKVLELEERLADAEKVIEHYTGNFDGRDGTHWRKTKEGLDYFFGEDKFGCASSVGGPKEAEEYKKRWGLK